MWNNGPLPGPRFRPPFPPLGQRPFPNSPMMMRPPGFDFCGPRPMIPPPIPPHIMRSRPHFVRGPRPRFENGMGHFGGPPAPLLPPPPPPPPPPMRGFRPPPPPPPRNFTRRGVKRKFVGGGGNRNDRRPSKMFKKKLEFACDSCDRSFESQALLDEHLSTHVKCDKEGCSFQAHPKIVELHVKLQHDTGLAERIMQINTPEAIEKWRNERKKNYPTAENVMKQQEERARKLARGELLQTKEFGRFNKGGRGNRRVLRRGMGRPRPRGISGQNGQLPSPLIDPGYISFEDKPKPAPEKAAGRKGGFTNWRGRSMRGRFRGAGKSGRNLGRFRGTKGRAGPTSAKAGGGGAEEAPAGEPVNAAASSAAFTDSETEACSALHPSAAGATSAASDDDDGPLQLSSKVQPVNRQSQPVAALPGVLSLLAASYNTESDDGPSKGPPSRSSNHSKKKHPQLRNEVQPAQQAKQTLLEMLLAKEIRHERNVVLQCIRYIVNHNFFGAEA